MLYQAGHKAVFPCADCPRQAELSALSVAAWEIFRRSASRAVVRRDKDEREVFEIDWQLTAWLLREDDRADAITETLLDLLRALNG